MHGMEVDYYKKLFQTIGNILDLIEKDDMPKYLLLLENAFPYMDNYNYHKGMKEIIQELKVLLKTKALAPTLTGRYYWIFRQPLKPNLKKQ